MNSIPEILLANARKWPDREALVWTNHGKDFSMSFSQLASSADGFAGNLIARGIVRGDRVLVFVPMSPALYVTLLGLFRIGATAVFVDPSAGLSHINACCQRIAPKAMVAVRHLQLAKPFVSGLRRIPILFSPPEREASALCVAEFPDGDDPALITFTSGSTGQPKAAVRTHRFLMAQHEALASAIDLQAGERDLTTLPVFVLANLASGVTSILPDAKISHPGCINAKRVAAQIRRLSPNRTGGSPAFYQRLNSIPGSLISFKKIYTGGAPVFPSLLKALKSASPDTAIIPVYGSTEAEPISHIDTSEIHEEDWHRMETGGGLLVGFPVPQIRVLILPDQSGGPISSFSPQPPGEPGEILVTGDHVLKGYLDGIGDETTKVKISNDLISWKQIDKEHQQDAGASWHWLPANDLEYSKNRYETWHRTGDAGLLDMHGRLWLLGRCSARISDSHGTIYPFTVECAASNFVKRSALVSHLGQRLLLVESQTQIPDANLKELRAAIAWAKIDRIRVIPKIPVDARHNAKVNYPALTKLIKKL